MKTVRLILTVTIILFVSITIRAQEIFDAVKANDLAKVKVLIEKDALLVNLRNKEGNTLLHQASIIGSIPIIEYLLSRGADINSENTRLNTPLVEAIMSGRNETIKLLIDKGADFQKQNVLGYAPIHCAAMKNLPSIVELLLSKGVNINIRNKSNQTPLHLAAIRNQNADDVAILLIKKGADVNARDRNNDTPLMLAAQYSGGEELIDLLIVRKAEFDTTLQKAKSILRQSAKLGSFLLFKYIIDKIGDRLFENEPDNNLCMQRTLIGGSIEIAEFLQKKNIPVIIESDINGWTPIHMVAQNNKSEMLEFLVKNGADINARTKSGKSAYNIAEENGNRNILNLVLKLGGNSEPQKFPVLKGQYLGQKPPGKIPELFAPDIFIHNHSTVAISPDGTELYWNSGSNASDGSIMVTKLKDGKWTKPEEALFSGKKYSKFDDCPFITPDNKKMFFISKRSINGINNDKENIWYAERTSTGWSEPKPVNEEINAMQLHWQISVSNNGTLYFNGIDAEGGNIRYSRYINGKFAKPEKIGIAGVSPFIAPDESYIIFARFISGRFIPFISFKSKVGRWNEPIDIQKYIGNSACCILSPDGKYIFADENWVSASFIEDLRPKE